MELLFVVLFAYLRKLKSEKLTRAAEGVASKAKETLPIEKATKMLPILSK
jgi:hypothetical protein